MKKLENLTEEAKQLLHPIKQRPNLEPSKEFVQELHQRIIMEGKKKKSKGKVLPILALASALLISTVIFLSSQIAEKDIATIQGGIDIEENSQLELIDTVEIGGSTIEGMNAIRSFDMEGGDVFLLDEANSQVMIRSEENTTSFPIPKDQNMVGVLEDILVTKEKEIYVLNSGEDVVYQFQSDGELIKTYDYSSLDSFFPDSLYELDSGGILLSQNQEQFVSLEKMNFLGVKDLPFHFERINRKESRLLLHDKGEQLEHAIYSDLGIGGVALQQLTKEQIIFTQTVTPPVFTPLLETHIFAIDWKGTKLGGLRVPVESFYEKPQRVEKYIAIEENRIYLLIPEKEQASLYEITLGKEYESLIGEQVEKVKIGLDYKTFGEPFPELEKEINDLFINRKIEYGNEDFLNGVAIDEHGTAVIDFKDFLAGSPASAQAQALGEALYSATFEKFPQIQEIYFQFDGSFSAWCYWLESTEEPWKRADSDRSVFSPFELTDQEEEVYNVFQQDLDINLLKGLEPISIAKLYVVAGFERKYDVQYALYTDREGHIQWSKEEDEKIPESQRGSDQQSINKFKNMDKGTFVQTSDYEGYIEYNTGESSDINSGFQMIKNENGIWQVAFMPIQ